MADIFIIGTGGANGNALSYPRFALAGRDVAVNGHLAQLPRLFKMEKSQIIGVFVLDLRECSGALGKKFARLLEKANTNLVDYIISRAQVVA